MSNYELYHYGVLGMKWGVRKNPTKAYIKAKKKRDRLDRLAKARNASLRRSTDLADRQRSYTDKQKHELELAKTRKDMDASNLDLAKRRYGDGRNDLFGFQLQNVGKAQQKLNKSTDAYDKQNVRTNKAILDLDTADSRVARDAARAESAAKKSERWQSAMNRAFKDVSPEAIQAGEAYFENLKKK